MKLILLITTLLIFPLYSTAHKFEAKYAIIDHPWLRIAGEQSITAAGYFELTNKLNKPIILIGAKAEFAKIIEIHEMKMEGDVIQMRMISGGLKIPPNGSLTLKPGGRHIMFTKLKEQLKHGEQRPVNLVFERHGEIVVSFKVEDIGRQPQHSESNNSQIEHSRH